MKIRHSSYNYELPVEYIYFFPPKANTMDEQRYLPEIRSTLQQAFDLPLMTQSRTELLQILAAEINRIILNDFNRLISILYRLDVSEQKITQVLKENKQTDAGILIAEQLIERQLQKILTRKKFSKPADNSSDEERW